MKHRLVAMLTAVFMSVTYYGIESHAQQYENTPVSISQEKVRIDGILYYSHLVLEKQTLFSISKAYNVDIDEIKAANPSISEHGLVKGTRILIPVEKKVMKETAGMTAEPQKEDSDKSAETDSAPEQQRPEQQEQVISFDEVDYQIHTVRWYENLQSIARKYNISEDLLIAFNKLESTVLKKRQKIRIPEQQYVQTLEGIIRGNRQVVPQEKTADTRTEEPVEALQDDIAIQGGEANVCVILPLGCSFDGSGANVNYMDFYSGVLLAARKLSEQGAEVNLNLLDTDGFNSCSDIAYHEYVRRSDVLIGPAMSRDIQQILANTDKLVVSPLDPKAENLVSSYRNVIQVPVSTESQFDNIADMIAQSRKAGEPVIVISETGGASGGEKGIAVSSLQKKGVGYKEFSYNILQGRGVDIRISQMLNPEINNHIIIASENEAFVNDVIRNINTLGTMGKFKVVTYGSSRLRNFETIEAEHYHNTNLHLAMNYYVDYDDPETMEFIMQYRAVFNTEPTPFAYQGYDIMMYFTKAVYRMRQGTTLDEIERERMLQSDMKFEKEGPSGGYINTATRNIEYKKGYQVSLQKF